jgi:hypothetical protein
MNPSQAMGTFLRVWREEWAGLSREQVAIAVSARAPRAKVTRYVVRKWEEGQPPHNTAELEALLAVMQRHGITRWEAEDFRQVVLASCASRQYPELFPDESIAYRDDVDEAARGLGGAEGNVVQLVACLKEVDVAVRGGQRSGVDWRQGRRQQAALGYLGAAIAGVHRRQARPALSGSAAASAADHLAAYFGRGAVGGSLSVGSLRIAEADAKIGAAQVNPGAWTETGRLWVRRLARLEEEARSVGDCELRLWALAMRLTHAEQMPADEAREALGEGERALHACQETGGEPLRLGMHQGLFACSVRLALPDRVERHLRGCERLAVVEPMQWAEVCYYWALGCGNVQEAQTWGERYLRMAEERRTQEHINYGIRKLAQCEGLRWRPRTVSIAK